MIKSHIYVSIVFTRAILDCALKISRKPFAIFENKKLYSSYKNFKDDFFIHSKYLCNLFLSIIKKKLNINDIKNVINHHQTFFTCSIVFKTIHIFLSFKIFSISELTSSLVFFNCERPVVISFV